MCCSSAKRFLLLSIIPPLSPSYRVLYLPCFTVFREAISDRISQLLGATIVANVSIHKTVYAPSRNRHLFRVDLAALSDFGETVLRFFKNVPHGLAFLIFYASGMGQTTRRWEKYTHSWHFATLPHAPICLRLSFLINETRRTLSSSDFEYFYTCLKRWNIYRYLHVLAILQNLL